MAGVAEPSQQRRDLTLVTGRIRGTDTLMRSGDKRRVLLRVPVTNPGNKVALYNFLSTFSGTHFVHLRTWQASVRHQL